MNEPYVLGLDQVDRTQVALVGGKAAQLGELSRLDGVRVPAGFCVTAAAYRRVLATLPSVDGLMDRMSRLDPDDRDAIRSLSAEVRGALESAAMPGDVASAIEAMLPELGEPAGYAVRSSATAEDLPTASFAGQQDTYLNVAGRSAVLQHVSRCWASLFTERAVSYRLRNGFDHRMVQMAVLVQKMVFPDVAGVLFTADPVTSNRKVAYVEATFGLGEALVGGLVNPDVYKVRDGEVIARSVAAKLVAVHPAPAGGTEQRPLDPELQERPTLTDVQLLALASLGRRIEAHFGRPQDVEWCLRDDELYVLQSRPITTLFPIPAVTDRENHVYISVGHQQMMTDPMRPLGLSVWQLTALRPMYAAGGRLFVDVTGELTSPASRARLLALARSDPLTGDALQTIVDRGDFPGSQPDQGPAVAPGAAAPPPPIAADPALVEALIERTQSSVAALQREIGSRTGSALLDFILADLDELKRNLTDRDSREALMAGIEATWWLNEKLESWLGEKNAADTLAQSAPNNVTSEMGLALLDVADVIRPHPEVIAYLQNVDDDGFLDELPKLAGGREAAEAIRGFLNRYGMRCAGEIDITRSRWSETPGALLPMILSNVRNFEPGAGRRRFQDGLREAEAKERDLLERLRALPDGDRKAEETKAMIDRLRAFIGWREYPKYGMVSRYFIYKRALLAEAARLVDAGVLHEKEDIFYLSFEELRDVVRTRRADHELIGERRDAFRSYAALTPPRVMTSDGEVVVGSYRRAGLPAGALVGLPVSAGVVEGRARVILDVGDANLERGDILVTAFTDPSWTPLFVAVQGLVTEVGGLMTHGAVIAREYGLPAVVGVVNATQLIRDGQRIRVNGTDGYVEILS